jgi:hypothetical protein
MLGYALAWPSVTELAAAQAAVLVATSLASRQWPLVLTLRWLLMQLSFAWQDAGWLLLTVGPAVAARRMHVRESTRMRALLAADRCLASVSMFCGCPWP